MDRVHISESIKARVHVRTLLPLFSAFLSSSPDLPLSLSLSLSLSRSLLLAHLLAAYTRVHYGRRNEKVRRLISRAPSNESAS